MSKNIVKNNAGISITQLFITMGLTAMIGLMVNSMMKTQNKFTKNMYQANAINLVITDITNILNNKQFCTLSFNGKDADSTDINIQYINKAGSTVIKYATGAIAQSKGLEIESFRIENHSNLTANEIGPMSLQINFQTPVKGVTPTVNIDTVSLPILVKLDAAGEIQECFHEDDWFFKSTLTDKIKSYCTQFGGSFDQATSSCTGLSSLTIDEICSLYNKRVSSDRRSCEGGECIGCCRGQIVTWDQCEAATTILTNGQSTSITNTKITTPQVTGSANITCEAGVIKVDTSTCNPE